MRRTFEKRYADSVFSRARRWRTQEWTDDEIVLQFAIKKEVVVHVLDVEPENSPDVEEVMVRRRFTTCARAQRTDR